MKKKLLIVISVIIALSCITAIVVSAATSDSAAQQVQRVAVNKEKTYYAYYNSLSAKGAVAFCLDNKFTAFGASEVDIQLCSKNSDGTYTGLYTVGKENLKVWFSGKQEYSVSTGDSLTSLLGGLSSVGVTAESEKTNVAFKLSGQSIEHATEYFVYIPQDCFIDESGVGNMGAYIEIEAEKVNGYTGDILEDMKIATSGIYDLALFGIESITGLIG